MNQNNDTYTFSRDRFDGVLFDLDGVVTATAKIHKTTWKYMFDDFLTKVAERDQCDFMPFSDEDYRLYVDGEPRYVGAGQFLSSRGLHLEYGNEDDPPGKETICGLGNLKERYFHEALEIEGVETYTATVSLISELHNAGFKTAVVSSSKNCRTVLEAARIIGLFDLIFDGNDAVALGLKGKPNPDVFCKAAGRLDIDPQRTVIIEDAIAGVAAGRAGGFGLVVGIDHTHHTTELINAGADVVVSDLSEFAIVEDGWTLVSPRKLPSAIERFDEITERAREKRVVVFLDYDGTLTPIVDRPELAVLSNSMRNILKELAKTKTVVIISGRDREDVEALVALDDMIYAGDHGFDISGPDGKSIRHEEGAGFEPILQAAGEQLHLMLDAIGGILIESKKASIAVHFRLVAPDDVEQVVSAVEEALRNNDNLRLTKGKKVLEILPRIEWDKGQAEQWLCSALGLEPQNSLTIYLGDDVTDEDAFKVLKGHGIGIRVVDIDSDEADRPTAADYCLRDPTEVGQFLSALAAQGS